MTTLTEKALAVSLENLLRKRPLDKITIKDITEACGVNRQTFYYHFHDIYALLEYLLEQKAEELLSECGNMDNWKDGVLLLIHRLLENKTVVLNAFRAADSSQARKFLKKLIRPALSDLSAYLAADLSVKDEDFDFVVDVFSFAFVGICVEWIAEDMDPAYLKKIDKFFLVIDGTLKNALEKFALSKA